MRRLCRYITRQFGSAWGSVGWGIFLCWLWLPWLFGRLPLFWIVEGLLDLLFVCWWAVDMVDQRVPAWAVALGTVLLMRGLLPHWTLLTLLAWLFYWVKVRR